MAPRSSIMTLAVVQPVQKSPEICVWSHSFQAHTGPLRCWLCCCPHWIHQATEHWEMGFEPRLPDALWTLTVASGTQL
jgi:hypothetical protein